MLQAGTPRSQKRDLGHPLNYTVWSLLLGRSDSSIQNLQTKLNDAWFKGAGNAAAATRRAAKGTTEAAGGQVEVSVIERVIHFRPELHLETFERGIEILVKCKIRRVVCRGSARVAAVVAEWAK